ncbi:MAG: MAPEG family protein [Pseudomonadota bacterium]
MVVGLYAAIFGISLSILYLKVVQQRRTHKVSLGDGGNDDLMKARSVHSNFVETIPFLLILMTLLEMNGYQDWVIHAFGLLAILGRKFHIIGIYRLSSVLPFRVMAGVLTLTLILAASGMLLFKYVV